MKRKEVLIAVIGGCIGALVTMIVGLFVPMGVVAQPYNQDGVGLASDDAGDRGFAIKRETVLIAVIGVSFGVLGAMMVGLFFPMGRRAQSFNQDGVFNKITCKQLTVVDMLERPVVELGSTVVGSGVTVYNALGGAVVHLGRDDDSFEKQANSLEEQGVWVYDAAGEIAASLTEHAVEVHNVAGEIAVNLGSTKDGGYVEVHGEDSGGASMAAGEHGGVVGVVGKDGGKASMAAGEHGGVVIVNGKDGGSIWLDTDEEDGSVTVLGRDGGSVRMDTDEYGGVVEVAKDDETRTSMSVNASGDGVVATWDRNGNRR